MDYNTQREKLILAEYGRNVQNMINHAKTIEDKEERNKAAETIIQVMGSMNPPLKDSRDYKHKLWDHLHIISDFELDIDAPFDPPEKEKLSERPEALPYPNQKIKYLHYGKMAELMLAKAAEMEDGENKDIFIKFVANQMKLSYITWNKDHVPDQVIFKAVETISKGKVSVKEGTTLYEHKEPIKPVQSFGHTSSNHGKKKYKGRGKR